MAGAVRPAGPIALVGAPDSDLAAHVQPLPMTVMQLDMSQEIIDQLLESVRGGKLPQILFGRTPQLRYGDETHMLQTTPEPHRCELYNTSMTSDDDDDLHFTGLVHHRLTVQQAEHAAAGVDSALEQLRSSMAAISEFKEANKTIVSTATPGRTPGHRRFPSSGFNGHLAPSKLGSPLLDAPASPMHKRPPTSQPNSSRDLVIAALRVPAIHLLARQPVTEAKLAATCRTSLANIRELLPKIAKRSASETDKWQLTDKAFRDINPFKFPYQSSEDREQAIDSAIKSFDRQRLAKDDKLWQILLPHEERGQGICLSRSKVKAPEAPKPSTPMHKISDLTKKKPAVKKADDKVVERKMKVVREAESKPRAAAKEPVSKEKPTATVKDVRAKAATPVTAPPAVPKQTVPASRYIPSTDTAKIRTKKAPAVDNSTPRVKPKVSARDFHRDRTARPMRPTVPVNTKPKNPSPLSASPPVNASDFEDSHPVHKALAAAPSPAKTLPGNSDRSLKRKANDIDSDIHNHNLAAKKPHVDRKTPNHNPSNINGRLNGSTPSSANSLKRKSDESSSSNTPTATKIRKVNNIDTGLASRYHHNNPNASPGGSSSSTTSPSMPSLSFRQTVELSQKFQKYYKKYEELYWQLTEAEKPPTEAQRNDLLKMHKKLEEMKREIKTGAGVHR